MFLGISQLCVYSMLSSTIRPLVGACLVCHHLAMVTSPAMNMNVQESLLQAGLDDSHVYPGVIWLDYMQTPPYLSEELPY